MSASKIKQELKTLVDSEKGRLLERFFKTGKGEYGEGDKFLGLNIPQQKKIAQKYLDLNLTEIKKLLQTKIHEYRTVALMILGHQYQKADLKEREKIYQFYFQNLAWINNWDLVDGSAPGIVGSHLLGRDRKILYRLAKSPNLWKRRIAILSTFTFIRESQFKDTLAIAKILLKDKHDLIHKAVGWMLRELGKKDQKKLEAFLDQYAPVMPRTMLRYSIEKFDPQKRKFYLQK